MKAVNYLEHRITWPVRGNHILADFDEETITVYQAYNKEIADAIVKNQNLHAEECLNSGYRFTRMSWIKTNFLWMMYRSNWAQKKNQERVLAFRITRTGFDEILANAVINLMSAPKAMKNEIPVAEKGDELNTAKVRKVVLQWDPDRQANMDKLVTRRAIQLGLSDEMLIKFSKEFIVSVCDITDFVHQQYDKC
jgi:hypothetical protein